MKKGLGKLYDRFTPDERFRLAIEALARGDEEEVERLKDTCPRETYRMNDLAFSERLRASQLISLYVCAELIELLGALRTTEAYQEAVETYQEALFSSLEWATEEAALSYHQGWDAGCDHAWQVAGKHGPFPWNDKATLNERAKEMAKRIREMAKRIKAESRSEASGGSHQDTLERISEALSVGAWTIWEAFSRFCREQLGLEPETVLRACFPPALGLPEELKDAAGNAQADPASLEDYEAMLVRTWCELVGRSN
jgi:hypothetical protein